MNMLELAGVLEGLIGEDASYFYNFSKTYSISLNAMINPIIYFVFLTNFRIFVMSKSESNVANRAMAKAMTMTEMIRNSSGRNTETAIGLKEGDIDVSVA